ncbi:MAG TPA: NADH-quinone oxidoreductase subunit C [Acidimicrobiia bacterium]|nr:NADH-quinone oxidoreductase subunit C [Acidimicrobiia bacterium]
MAADTDTAAESEAPADPRTALLPEAAALLERFRARLGDAVVDAQPCFGDAVVRVTPDAWLRAARVVHDELGCDYLSFIAGIDWMPTPVADDDAGSGDTSAPVQPRDTTYGVTGSEGRFQLLARMQSTSTGAGITLKTDVAEDAMRVASWTSVYPGADWHERETWEMYGIEFDGHPALRHLYLPSEFDGHPLRKDYPLLAREVKPWPGLVDVEAMPGEEGDGDDESAGGE